MTFSGYPAAKGRPKDVDLVLCMPESDVDNELSFINFQSSCIVEQVSDVSAIRAQLSEHRARSAIVVGNRGQFTAQLIIEIERHMAAVGSVWGIWCPNPESIIPKSIDRGSRKKSVVSDVIIDAPNGITWSPDCGWQRIASINSVFIKPYRICLLLAHGDGSHLDLGDAIFCGLVEGTETVDSGRLEGGCNERFCKKQAGHPGLILHGQDVNADLLVMLSCNSMSLASELYPSSLSLALSAFTASGKPVIGTISQLPFSSEIAAEILRTMSTADNIGAAVAILNSRWRQAGIPCAYLLLGDPLVSFSLAAPRAESVSVSRRIHSDHPNISHKDERLMWKLRNTIDSVTRAATEAALRNASMAKTLGGSLHNMAAAQALVDSRVWQMLGPRTLGDTETLLGLPRARPLTNAAITEINHALDDWGTAFLKVSADTLLGGGSSHAPVFGDGLTEVLGRHLSVVGNSLGPACQRCGSPVTVYALKSHAVSMYPRRRAWCPVCGPLEDRIQGAFTVKVEPDNYVPSIGEHVELKIQVMTRGIGPFRNKGVIQLLIEVRDKSVASAIHHELKSITPSLSSTTVCLPVPLGAGADLHSIRVIAAYSGLVATARCLMTPLPTKVHR
jgi:hypothetical protein